MFDSPSDFFALVIAIVAFIFARKAFNQVAALRARLDAIESAPILAKPVPVPPPLTPLQELEQTLATSSPPTAPGQSATDADAEPVAPIASSGDATSQGAGSTAPPPLPQPGPGIE